MIANLKTGQYKDEDNKQLQYRKRQKVEDGSFLV